jgi:flagellar hook-length control protein FliK
MEEDADLLKDLLQASPIDILDKQKVPMPLEVTPIDSELKTDTELDGSDVIKESEDNSDISHVNLDEYRVPKPIETADEKISLLRDSDIETSNVVSAQTVKQGVESSLNQAGKGQDGALFVAVDNTSAKKQGELLAKLPPEAESSVIETIATRVESVISDIKAEGKSTEFIAALQSGVKEMKEQLKQGREPGIDLKTLVTDALAESNVKVSGSAEPALDKQLSQMSTILATANSLNQTSQQQNYLNTGLNEVQGIKEISQQQIESTRLAQQNVAVNEKAVNIFKPEGQQQLADKVRWMANSRNLTAEIRLDPPDLGGMNIKVSLSGDSASVSFVVQSQQARDALDQAVPRLREMLAEQGIELGQSSVEQDSSGHNQQSEQGSFANNSSAMGNLAQQSQDENENSLNSSGEFIEQRISGGRIGGIDYYA